MNLDKSIKPSQPKYSKITVLLPESGRLATLAKAIKQGILTSFYNNSNFKPELDFIDTENNPNKIIELYQQAVNNKSDLIIGPLNKLAVNKLNNYISQTYGAHNSQPPLLALNYIPEDFTTNC